jgi:hypothetical protein
MSIFIVNSFFRYEGNSHLETSSHYYHTEAEAQDAFNKEMNYLCPDDDAVIELIQLDTETMDATTLKYHDCCEM